MRDSSVNTIDFDNVIDLLTNNYQVFAIIGAVIGVSIIVFLISKRR